MAKNVKSIEKEIEFHFKDQLKKFKIKFFNASDDLNTSIKNALESYHSKSGGNGKNFPDIQVLIVTKNQRFIPVMIEAKGKRGDLIKFCKNSTTEIDSDNKAVTKYAVNGAIHYVNALIEGKACSEAIAVGINGWHEDNGDLHTEVLAYYLSEKTNFRPLKIDNFDDLSFLKKANQSSLLKKLAHLCLSDEELESLRLNIENEIDKRIQSIHQNIYEDDRLKTVLTTNEKLFVFCGLIMAGLSVNKLKDLSLNDFKGNDTLDDNDGMVIINRIESFLKQKKTPEDKKKLVIGILTPVFSKKELWRSSNGESYLKILFGKIKQNIIPYLVSDLHLDFAGKIFNRLSDWVHIENDKNNDVVFTPRYLTTFMAKLARTDRNSYVLDSAMGSAGFLVSAMGIMIDDAKNNIKDASELEKKINEIKSKQILGIEILNNIYILAILNMILMGDGSSNLLNANSFEVKKKFPATVFLLNPPYSAPDCGLNFVNLALKKMTNGYGCVLIQENAGSGKGVTSAREILKHNTLVASIHLPSKVFIGKSSVQVAIYLFKVNQPHDLKSNVLFIDMSEDGYARTARSKSGQSVNLRNVDHAHERYQEVLDLVLDRETSTDFYNKANGNVIKGTITLNGDDWTFAQHKDVDLTPTFEDFKKTVSDYLAWKVSSLIKDKSNFQ